MKKTILSLILSLTVISSVFAPTQTQAQNKITITGNENYSQQQLADIVNFLDEYHLISLCLGNKAGQEAEPLSMFTASCLIMQVFDTERLTRRKAWEKAKKINLIRQDAKQTQHITSMEFLTMLFQAAGVTISPLDESKYKNNLKKLRLSLPRQEFNTLAIAFENGIIKEPETVAEARELKNKITVEIIDIPQALAYLYQTSTGAHDQTTIISISPYSPPSATITLESTLKEVINTIKSQSYYSKDFDEKKDREAAIKALVRSLEEDQYIEYYTAQEYEDFSSNLNGNLEGIGAYIEEKDNKIIIVSPIEGSPAAKAGLLPEDIITHIDDNPTDGMSLQEAVNHIRGTKGTQVKLTILRGSKTMTFTITRKKISIPALTVSSKDGFEIIKLVQFSNSSSAEMRAELETISDKSPRGIVIDLRNNPGGFLNEVVDIVDFFLEKNKPIVYLKDRHEQVPINASTDPIISGIPISILINKGSASASEILAGTLQSYGIA